MRLLGSKVVSQNKGLLSVLPRPFTGYGSMPCGVRVSGGLEVISCVPDRCLRKAAKPLDSCT